MGLKEEVNFFTGEVDNFDLFDDDRMVYMLVEHWKFQLYLYKYAMDSYLK